MSHFLSIDPIFTVPQVLLIMALMLGAAAWFYRRTLRSDPSRRQSILMLAGLRLFGVLMISILLLNPVLSRVNRDSEKPPLLLLLDTSHSMALPDVDHHRRFDVARDVTIGDTALMRHLQERYNCRLFEVGETATPQEVDSFLKTVQPDGPRTNLGEALTAALDHVAGSPSGGVLLVSDGRNNGEMNPMEAAHLAKTRQFPVFTLCLGDTHQAPDVSVVSHRQQVFAVPEQRVTLTAEIRCVGYGGQRATVDLLRQDTRVESREIVLDDHKPSTVSFAIQEKKEGSYRYTLSVRPMPQETVTSNNRSGVFVQVLRDKTRILVLEGRPGWEAKFLIRALRSDPSMEVDALFKITGDKFFATRGTTGSEASSDSVRIPRTPADFARYDVIVIGKGYEELFDASGAEALKGFVSEHAGNLIFLRGKAEERADSLRALEPVQWSTDEVRDIRMQVTEEGQRNPAFHFSGVQDPQLVVQRLPTMISATRVEGEKALSVVLARAAGVPSVPSGKEMAVVAYQNYGQGKVLSLVGEGLWRWALLPPELKEYTDCYFDFWSQLIRWMVNQSDFLPGQDVSLKTDHTTYSATDTVKLMAYVRGKTKATLPPVTLTMPDGTNTQITLGAAGGAQADFVGTFRPTIPGEYLASLVRPRAGAVMAPFSVFPDREEDRITSADPELMNQIARSGGGEALTLDTIKQLPDKLREARATLSDKSQAHSAWDRAWVLALILGVLAAEWALRRRFGLL